VTKDTPLSPLYNQKVGVWCSISQNMIMGPIFFTETITSECCYEVILCTFFGHLSEGKIAHGCFQHCCATAHTAHVSMKLLRDVFRERIISKDIWPP
jgi:hypothetical protein